MSGFLEKLHKKGAQPVYCLYGRDKSGRPCYYVLLCAPEKLKLLLNTKTLVEDLSAYAQVIVSGFGTNIPDVLRKKLALEYGCSFKDE